MRSQMQIVRQKYRMLVKPHPALPAAILAICISCVGFGGRAGAGPDVYVAGTEQIDGRQTATLWKNGVPQRLGTAGLWGSGAGPDGEVQGAKDPKGYDAWVKSVAEYGGDVYVAGAASVGGASAAVLWKNGRAQQLAYDNGPTRANSVFASGEGVYAVGQTGDTFGGAAAIWENGAGQALAADTASPGGSAWAGRIRRVGSTAKSVFVSGGDVYAAGNYTPDDEAIMLWKNGAPQPLTTSSDGTKWATSVFVSGKDVYVAGNESIAGPDGYFSAAYLWKNGDPRRLGGETTKAEANSVYVSGRDVYVAGAEIIDGKRAAVLWKNGKARRLGDGSSESAASSVFVHRKDVYVAGTERTDGKDVATLWKNGAAQRLGSGDGHCAVAQVIVK